MICRERHLVSHYAIPHTSLKLADSLANEAPTMLPKGTLETSSRRTALTESLKRQVNFDQVYQAGGLLIDDGESQTQAFQLPSSSEQESLTSPVSSTPVSAAVAQTVSSAQPSTGLPTQISTNARDSEVNPTLSAQQAAQQTFLVAPTSLIYSSPESRSSIGMLAMSSLFTTSLSLQATSSSHITTSTPKSSTSFSLSTPSSLLPQGTHTSTASNAYVILPNTSSIVTSSTGTTKALSADSSHHTSEFYVGIAFLSIVVAALCLSFVAWIIRSRRSNLFCCSGNRDDEDDMEKQDAAPGLGFFLGDSKASTSSVNEKFYSSSYNTYSPYHTAKPAQVYLGSAESLVPNFGALRIKNLVPGDVHSSGDEMSRQASRVGCEMGTPREEIPGSTPRFLGLDGMGLDVPWSSFHLRSARSPSHVSILQSPSRRSLSAKEEGHNNNWEGLPPLPIPIVSHNSENTKSVGMDGWGATIRSGFRAAMSAVTGGQSQKTSPPITEDYFTSMPSRPSRSDVSRNGSTGSRRRPSYSSALEDAFHEVAIDAVEPKYSHKPFGPGAGFSGDFSKEVTQAVEVSPLVIRKKSHAGGRRGSNHSTRSRVLLAPGGIYRSRDSLTPAGISSSASSPAVRSTSMYDRPKMLKRGSTSGFSDASGETDISQAFTAEEMAAQRVMRARRTTASGYF